MSQLTQIFQAIQDGHPVDSARLLPLVYEELRTLARQKLANEKPGISLQATALVHEAFLKIFGEANEPAHGWQSRAHFFGAAAQAMRRILVDAARNRNALKRGGLAVRHELDDSAIAFPQDEAETLAIHDVLDHLESVDHEAAQLVKLRFFVGLNMQEIADSLDISLRKAHDLWSYARAWLRQELQDAPP